MSNASSVNSSPSCTHTSHLFEAPLCQHQPLITRIAHIAFHILLLGIPLAIYRIWKCYFPRTASTQPAVNPLPAANVLLGDGGVQQQNKDLDEKLSKDTIDFSLSKINSFINPIQFTHTIRLNDGTVGFRFIDEPQDRRLCYLQTLWNDSMDNLMNSLKNFNGKSPWEQQEIQQQADICMKMGYAVGVLSLQEVQKKANNNKSFIDILSSSGAYRLIFFNLPRIYRVARCHLNLRIPYDGAIKMLVPDFPPSEEHAKKFYQNNTIQHTWRRLYNDYCARIRTFVEEKAFYTKEMRFLSWTKPDRGNIDPLPTHDLPGYSRKEGYELLTDPYPY